MSGHQRVPNAVVYDGRLSYRALGVLTALLARQAVGAPMSADALAAGEDREGRKAIQAAMRELTAAGLFHTIRVSRGRGRIVTVSGAYPEPVTAAVARMHLQGLAIREDGLSPDDNRPDDPLREDGYRPSVNGPVVPTGPNHGKIQRDPQIRGARKGPHVPPTCPACGELHYPSAACSAALPLLASAGPAKRKGGPTPGRGNAWSPTARRAGSR